MITIFDLNAAVLQTRRNPNISICSFIISTLDRSSLEKSATYYLLGIDCLKTGLFDDKPNFKGIPIYYSKELSEYEIKINYQDITYSIIEPMGPSTRYESMADEK